MASLSVRKAELQRHVENIPQEVAAWKTATRDVLDMNAHFNQLAAIDMLIEVFVTRQRIAAGGLAPQGDPAFFQNATLSLLRDIVRAQKTWDFFRDKLDLRYSPAHKDALWVADTIAWDCHRTTLNLAVQHGVIKAAELREPPLVYCTAESSPATWVRGSRPNDGRRYDLGEATLPIPVIELPWDHLGSGWEYLTLHHEVGHDIEADLKLRAVLQSTLRQKLVARQVPQPRIDAWLGWQGEVFADLCAIRLAGPAFVDALMQLLILPGASVKAYDPGDPHPTPYVRILMNAAYAKTLGPSADIDQHVSAIETEWQAMYGASTGNTVLDGARADFSLVFDALTNAPLAELQGRTVASLLPFLPVEDARIRGAARFFQTGTNPPNQLPIRHVPAAARLAINAAAAEGVLTTQLCDEVHQRVLAYVRSVAPAGLRGAASRTHRRFVEGFADRMKL